MASANYRLNSFYALCAKGGGAVATLLTTMLLARMLSKSDFAAFVMASSVVAIGSLLGQLGMGSAILRFAGLFLGRERNVEARQVTRRCLSIGFCSLIVVVAILLCSHGWFSERFATWPREFSGTVLVGAWTLGAGLLVLATSGLRAYGMVGLGSFTEITLPRIAILSVTLVFFLLNVDSLALVLGSIAITMFLVSIFSVAALTRLIPRQQGAAVVDEEVEQVSRSKIASFALPILYAGVMQLVFRESSLFFVGSLCAAEEIASYGAAFRIWGIVGLPQSAVYMAIQGRIAELNATQDDQAMESLVRNSANLAALPTALITIVVCIAAGPILALLYGPSYAAGAEVLTVLCLFQFVSVAMGPCDQLLAMSGKLRSILIVTTFATIAAYGFGWGLTSSFGPIGAAWACGISILFCFKLPLALHAWFSTGVPTWVGVVTPVEKLSDELAAPPALKAVETSS